MPRQGRIDFPGALHHVIIRGINKAPIFLDDADRDDFLKCLEAGLTKTKLSCFAWALLPNHVHLLLRTGAEPLNKLMSSVLTGYAIHFNHRHKRVGYLFQNRYKSILCEEDKYLIQLVRYIHLNPLRAGLVAGLAQLNKYHWCGHAVLLGNRINKWQATSTILSLFGSTASVARRQYLEFVQKGIPEGRRNDLTGGGLIRSAGGWQNLETVVKAGERYRGDERILGSSDFVLGALKEVDGRLTRKTARRAEGWNLELLLSYVVGLTQADIDQVLGKRRDSISSKARALFVWWATSELGYTLSETAEFLSINISSAMRARGKGKGVVHEEQLKLIRP